MTDINIRSLARAKIMQHFLDLAAKSKLKSYQYNKLLAHQFFESLELEFWCDLAEIPLDTARKKYQEIKDGGLQWRKEAGKGDRYYQRKRYRELYGK